MKTTWIALCALAPAALAGEETSVAPTIESVALFKNGLAVVRATFPVAGPGIYRWDKVPRAVHGSFWVESDGAVSVQSTTRMIEETDENDAPSGDLQRDLAGKDVEVTLKSGDNAPPPSFRGKVWAAPALRRQKSGTRNTAP